MAMPLMADATCWTLIECAAAGDRGARDTFAELYLPLVRDYLEARWKARLSRTELEDAVQDVFVECLKCEGVLEHNRERRGQGFRAYLLGAVRNVALRVEARGARRLERGSPGAPQLEHVPDDEQSSSRVFDRSWAATIMREAAERQQQQARARGSAALRRVELLRRIFQDGQRIADIAREWGVPSAGLHHEYARARREFAAALREIVAFHAPECAGSLERECADLIDLLGEG
jgi:DNA-directed RNA polymerase specialized sigma24 family protein